MTMSLARVRSSGPLGKLQREADILKTKIDEVTGITNKWSPKTADDPQVIKCHQDCVQYKIEASSLLLRANELLKIDEPKLVSNFEQKKEDEIKRLQSFQVRLDRLINGMERLDNGDQLRKTEKEDTKVEMKQDDKDVEDGEEEQVEGEVLVEEEDVDDLELYVVNHAFKKEREGDLGISVGDVLEILNKRNDGWWKAKNDDGETGLVPSNFLKPYDDDDDDDEDDDDEDDAVDDADDSVEDEDVSAEQEKSWDVSSVQGSPRQTGGREKSAGATESAEQAKTSRSQDLQSEEYDADMMMGCKCYPAGERGKDMWKGIRDSLVETGKTDVTDVLAAMGAFPAGFRPSTLHNLTKKGPQYSLRNAILPKLTESNLAFHDLFLDPVTTQVRKTATRVLRSCRLMKCNMIPLLGTGVEVLSHHVRMCVFDGSKILSNIHTVRAIVDPMKPKIWSFQPYTGNTTYTAVLPTSLTDAAAILRTDHVHSNVGILFELGVTYIRNPPRRVLRFSDGPACEYSDTDDDLEHRQMPLSGARQRLRQTGERGELSCGWAHLKLFDEQGVVIPNRPYKLRLNGGTPYEHGVDVDPSIARRAPSNRLRVLLSANKHPTISVQIGTPSSTKRAYLELLPSTIFLPASYGELVAFHRRVLADALVRDRLVASDADLIHSPAIATFLSAINKPDIMDAMLVIRTSRKANVAERDQIQLKSLLPSVCTLEVIWNEKKRHLTRADKRDKEHMKSVYKSVVMETAYPLLHLQGMPEARWADAQLEQMRGQQILKTIQNTRQENGVVRHLLTSAGDMAPFDIQEVTFDLLRDHWRSLS